MLVDGGVLPEPGVERQAALQRLDALVAQVRAADPAPTWWSPAWPTAPRRCAPRAVVAAGPSYPRGLLESASTRQPGLVQLQDLTATALARVGASVAEVTGRPLTVAPSTGSAAALLAGRVGFETRAATLRASAPRSPVAGRAYALWALVVAVLWWRRGRAGGCRAAVAAARGGGGGHGAGVDLRRQPRALVAGESPALLFLVRSPWSSPC